MKTNFTVVGIGECLWDCFKDGRRLGGSPMNYSYYAGKLLGMDNAFVVSVVGKDALGEEALVSLNQIGLQRIIPHTDFPTGRVMVTVENGIPSYNIVEDVAYDHIPWSDGLEDLAHRTDLVCFGSLAQRNAISRTTIARFLDMVPTQCLKVYDINLRQSFYSREVVNDSLLACNILKINDEELFVICNLFGIHGNPEACCRTIMNRWHIDVAVLTCGGRESFVFTEECTSCMETPQVKVVDTVGAGDSFGAAFCSGLLCGMPVSECHRLAVELSAYVCTQPGAIAAVPAELISSFHNRL